MIVGNISVEGWGPPNYLEYIKRFTTFEADIALLVVNSQDYADAPSFEPLTRMRPQRKPLLALQELVDKYLPLYARQKMRARKNAKWKSEIPTADQIQMCLDAVKEIVGSLRKSSVQILFAQHLDNIELAGEPYIGHGELR